MALKSLGFSIEEIRRTTMARFIAFADLAFDRAEDDGVREATQADIDALLG